MKLWTEEQIRAEVSWDAFRDGRKLVSDGLVGGLKIKPGLITATVGGGKRPTRVVVRTSAALEAQCDCPVNRGTGALCCHAVAALLQALAAAPPPGTVADRVVEKVAIDSTPGPAVSFHLPPDFRKALAKGRLGVEWREEGEIHEADRRFWQWLGGVADLSAPPRRLALGAQNLETFIEAISGHPRIFATDGQRIEVGVMPPLRLLDSHFSEGKLHVTIVDQTYQTIDGISRLGWSIATAFGFSPWTPDGPDEVAWWREGVRSGRFEMDLERLRDRIQPLLDLSEEPRPGWLGKLSIKTIDSIGCVRLEGGLRVLDLSIEDEGGGVVEVDPGTAEIRRTAAIQTDDLIRLLSGYGFENVSGKNWKLVDSDKIYDFLGNGIASLRARARLVLGERLQHVIQSIHVVRPVVSPSSRPGSLAVELSFQTGNGVVIPRAKILEWIRSGKKSVRTKSGAEVVLSRQVREEFEPLAADLGIVRPEGVLQLDRARAEVLSAWAGGARMGAEPGIALVSPPDGIRLRGYQEEGLSWICSRLLQLGAALLADEMGLGKTLQTLLAVRSLQAAGKCGRVLVLVPGSLLANWEQECHRFAPDARVLRLHGEGRDALRDRPADLVLTSYGTFQRDLAFHLGAGYGLVVLDEASLIRNPDSAISRDVAKIDVPMRLALTGTPMENRLSDLWSIFRFLSPGYLGGKVEFRERYEGDVPAAASRLRARVGPFVLRRTKADVARDLPEKVESDVILEMEPSARRVYREIAAAGLTVAEAQASASAARMHLLTTLLRLRQACLDPALLPGGGDAASVKNEWLKQMLESKLESGSYSNPKCLVFSQFAGYLRNLEKSISGLGWRVFLLDGSTRDRGARVADFQSCAEPAVFLISLKAGGYGLNLTAADTVVHMDPWWNPAVEAQATDRAHRIGQTMPVTVYRLIIRDSVEERVRWLQSRKRALMTGLDGEDPGEGWSESDLADLIR